MTRFAAVLALVAAGCTASERERGEAARAESVETLESMSRAPRVLPRPLLLISGWNDDPAIWADFRSWLDRCACNARVVVFVVDTRGIGGAREAAARLCAEYAGLGEVDIVAHSLGGLVAREAARSCRGEKRLRVARLWTIATPHKGSGWSLFHRFAPYREQVADCRPYADFIRELQADPSSCAMPISTYRCRGDVVVSRKSASAAGDQHFEFERARVKRVHEASVRDPRIAKDVIEALFR